MDFRRIRVVPDFDMDLAEIVSLCLFLGEGSIPKYKRLQRPVLVQICSLHPPISSFFLFTLSVIVTFF